MAGFDLSASRSGKPSEKAQPVISKKGKADLRYGLYQAALVASIRTKAFKKYFDEKIQGREKEKGIKTKMRVKLAAKMLVIAWTLMKNKEPFNPKYIKITENSLKTYSAREPGQTTLRHIDLGWDNTGPLTEFCNLDKG